VKCAICTLFEHSYHLGAAVLVNSLCAAGYAGPVYAGFRGPLPAWAEGKVRQSGEGRWEMPVTDRISLVFMELKTPAHLTNYKPDFILQVEALAVGSDAVIYLDPDIVVGVRWDFLEEWQSCGITVCEDVNSPLGRNHPRRVGWKRFFAPFGYDLQFQGPAYANGGYVGVPWAQREFLVTWRKMIGHIADALGGWDVAGISGGRSPAGKAGFADCLDKSDQDALNAAIEAHPEMPVSLLPPATMGFQAGRPILPHALGQAKPWLRKYASEALHGKPPRAVDKAFWAHVEGPLRPYTSSQIARRRFFLALGSGIGRVIRRT
jgi:hypothetical protein